MYVDVNEVCEDWGVSRAQGYKMIKELNERMKSINPTAKFVIEKNRMYTENASRSAGDGIITPDNMEPIQRIQSLLHFSEILVGQTDLDLV